MIVGKQIELWTENDGSKLFVKKNTRIFEKLLYPENFKDKLKKPMEFLKLIHRP